MKKTVIIIIISVVVVGLIIAGSILLISKLSSAIKDKDPITVTEFKTKMENKEYTVVDVQEQFAEFDYVKNAYVALEKEGNYQIEFYEISDEANAVGFYGNNKALFESSKGTIVAETNITVKNYAKYTVNSGGKYNVVSRIANTVVYVSVDSKYKDAVNDVLNSIGY